MFFGLEHRTEILAQHVHDVCLRGCGQGCGLVF